MFQGFSQRTGDFLWELSFNNERPWFLEHKEEFEEVLNRPFKALAAETTELLNARTPGRDFQVHVSRIYRDARRLFGRGPYKDHLWFAVYEGGRHTVGPCFWFEIGAATWSAGVGFWDANPETMAAFRRLVDANPARFERLIAPLERDKSLKLWGQEYKRPKGNYGEPIAHWYNRKYLSLGFEKDCGGALFTPELPQLLADTYEKLLPLYDYIWEFYRLARTTEEEGERP